MKKGKRISRKKPKRRLTAEEIEKKKKRIIKTFITIVIIIVLGIIALIANNFIILDKNKNTNLVINNKNVTSNLKNNVLIENGTIYLSEPDIANFFDKHIYEDTEINKVITTYEKKIATIGFEENEIEAVINFAGFKAVGESVREPLKYYYDNVAGAIILLQTMSKYGVKKFVFSSSATVYGEQKVPKCVETMERRKASNPYGNTKIMIEQILEDMYNADKNWKISILRYFNPVGAHESGLIGDNPNGIPNNLMPYVQKVAIGELKELTIFGNDYNTPDGTCRRDYLHVVDLAIGHIKALEKLEKSENGVYAYNLGTGTPVSVLEIVTAFMKVNNIDVPFKYGERRPGDLAELYADPTKAEKELGWKAERTIEDMCRDSWNYIQKNK